MGPLIDSDRWGPEGFLLAKEPAKLPLNRTSRCANMTRNCNVPRRGESLHMGEAQSETILTGSYLYDDCLRLAVRIDLCPTRFGTGDWEDEPEIQDDVEVPTYVVWYETTAGMPKWVGGFQCSSLEEAKAAVSEVGHSLRWD
jgi:hypothetical protein